MAMAEVLRPILMATTCPLRLGSIRSLYKPGWLRWRLSASPSLLIIHHMHRGSQSRGLYETNLGIVYSLFFTYHMDR